MQTKQQRRCKAEMYAYSMRVQVAIITKIAVSLVKASPSSCRIVLPVQLSASLRKGKILLGRYLFFCRARCTY